MAMTEAEKRRSEILRDRKKNKKTGAQRVADTQKRRSSWNPVAEMKKRQADEIKRKNQAIPTTGQVNSFTNSYYKKASEIEEY